MDLRRSWRRPTSRRPVVALLATCLITTAACSGGSSDGPGATPSDPTSSTSAVEPAERCTTADPDECPLRIAAAEADLLIGTAAKLGDPAREELQAQEFDAITAETEFLFSVVHPGPDEWNFEGADRVVAFAEEHDLDLTATHFVWDPPAIPDVVPDWLRAITDPDELRAVLRDHFEVLRDRYAGKVDRWNVVNEAIAPGGGLQEASYYYQVLGPGYVAEIFAIAEEVWPETQLVLNQDLTEYLAPTADDLVGLVTDLIDGGARVDRVGLQGHFYLGEPDWDLVTSTMASLAELGVVVDLTEIDVPLVGLNENEPPIDLATQAAWTARLVRICLDQPACRSITFWGFEDGDTWLDDFLRPGTRPLPYDEDLQPKPMRTAVVEELQLGRPDP